MTGASAAGQLAASVSATSLAAAAHAGYLKWEMVELPAASGVTCGNGTPYRFFVNRTPFTSKTVVVYEGGGAERQPMLDRVED